MSRTDWNRYFMEIARVVSSRATCDRKHVGAVLVRERLILSTGYNGSLAGRPHCDEAGHMMEDGHCVRTLHAEANALLQAARSGAGTAGATLYVTASPCWGCFRLLAGAGVVRCVYGEEYRLDPRVAEHGREMGIELVRL